MTDALDGHPLLGRVLVRSAGADAKVALEPCALVRESAGPNSAVPTPPRPLTLRRVDAADLILTAEASQRAAVVRLLPHARTKTFTLVEAARLAQGGIVNGSLDVTDLPSEDRLHSFVSRLNASRGHIRLEATRTQRRFLRSTIAIRPLDITDGHGLSRSAHHLALSKVGESVAELAAVMRATF